MRNWKILLFAAISCFSVTTLEAARLIPQDDLFSQIDGFVNTSVRIRNLLTVRLDGSPEASNIQRVSKTRDELIFINRSQWRTYRESPFQKIAHEYATSDKGVLKMSIQNKGVLSPEPLSESVWIEVVLAPVRLASKMGIADNDWSIEKLLSKLKDGPLANKEQTCKIELEQKPTGELVLKYSGFYMHDKKTKALIEGSWEVVDRGKLSEKDLSMSLTRSF